MKGLWDVAGLPANLQGVYAKLSEGRRLVTVGSERLITYSGSLGGVETAVAELIRLGLAERRTVGQRRIVVLGTWEVLEKRFAGSRAVVSNIFTDDMARRLERYSGSQLHVIERTFMAFGTLRRGGKVAPGVLVRQLEAYERYPVAAVVDGLRIYQEGGYAEKGYDERYALGIVRGCAKNARAQPESVEEPAPGARERDAALVQRRALRQEERERVDLRVIELVRERYGLLAELSDVTPSEVKDLIGQACQEIKSG